MIGIAIIKNRLPLGQSPGLITRLTTYLTTNTAETSDDHVFPELRTRTFSQDAENVHNFVGQAATDLGWRIVSSDSEEKKIEVEISTPLLKFRDDMVVEIIAIDEQHSALKVRSRSRVGKGDLGANTRHILDLYQAMGSLSDYEDMQ